VKTRDVAIGWKKEFGQHGRKGEAKKQSLDRGLSVCCAATKGSRKHGREQGTGISQGGGEIRVGKGIG